MLLFLYGVWSGASGFLLKLLVVTAWDQCKTELGKITGIYSITELIGEVNMKIGVGGKDKEFPYRRVRGILGVPTIRDQCLCGGGGIFDGRPSPSLNRQPHPHEKPRWYVSVLGSQRIKEPDCGMVQRGRYYWTVFVTLSLHTYTMHAEAGPETWDNSPSILAGVELPWGSERGGGAWRRGSGEKEEGARARPRTHPHSLSLKGYPARSASLCLPRALSWQKWRHHLLAQQPRLSIYEGFLTNRQAGHAWVPAFIPHSACLHRTSTISAD